MTELLVPVDQFSLILSLIIGAISLLVYQDNRSRMPLWVGIGFFLFGFSFIVEIISNTVMMDYLTLLLRMAAFVTILAAVYANIGEVRRQLSTLSEKNILLESEAAERKRAEHKLRNSEARMSAVIRGSPIPQFVIDSNHTVLFWNDALAEYSGILSGDIIGTSRHQTVFYAGQRQTLADLIADGKIEEIPSWYGDKAIPSSLVEGAYEVTDFFRGMGRDGRWLHITAAPVWDESGSVIGAVETLEDITERRRAEQSLTESEEKYRLVANYNYDWEFWEDPSGKFVYISPSCERISGYRPEQFIADPGLMNRIVLPEDLVSYTSYTCPTKQETPASFDFRIRTKSGGICWISQVCQPIYDQNGMWLGRRGSNQDITERKQADLALQTSEARLSAIVRGSPLPQFVIDSRHRIIYWNTALEEFTGIPARDVIGTTDQWRTFSDYAEPSMADHLLEGTIEKSSYWKNGKWKKARFIEGAYETTVPFPKKGEPGSWLEFTAAPIRDAGGAVIGAVETLEDVSERTQINDYIGKVSALKARLLGPLSLAERLSIITTGIVEIWGADFARIWILDTGDLCTSGCIHSSVTEGPYVCRDRSHCLHLVASSGRYPSIEGTHRRVPLGAYKIGRLGSGELPDFLTNDLINDDRFHNPSWARELGLAAFAGYQLNSDGKTPIGAMALFSRRRISPWEDELLKDLASTASQVILRGFADKALEEREIYLKTIFTAVQTGLVVIDPRTHCITDANPAAARMLGEEPGTLTGAACHRYVCPAEEGKCPISDLGQRIDNTERMLVRKNGEKVPILKTVVPVTLNGRELYLESFLEITERKRMEDALRASEAKYRSLTENTPDVVFASDMNGTITYVSPKVNEYGFLIEELTGRSLFSLIHPDDRARVQEEFRHQLAERARFDSTFRMPDKWEIIHYFDERSNLVLDEFGNPVAIDGLLRDVTDRKNAEDEVRRSLQEKEVLLKEIHHRVKNNLQVVWGLIDLQITTLKDPHMINTLRDSQNRVRTMSLIHETLYRSDDLSHIRISQYLKNLITTLYSTYSVSQDRIGIAMDVEDRQLDVESAIPCGLIVNELMSNTFKHAFPGDRTGEIRIGFREEGGSYILSFHDNGVGIPPGLDFMNTESLGMKLISILSTDQLDGTLRRMDGEGTGFIITFPKR